MAAQLVKTSSINEYLHQLAWARSGDYQPLQYKITNVCIAVLRLWTHT